MHFHNDPPAAPASRPALRAIARPEEPRRPDAVTLAAHLARRQYGAFRLTEAVRPGWQLDVVPRAGYRHDAWVDPHGGTRLPALVAAVSSEELFETFIDLLEPLGDTCDVVVESTHEEAADRTERSREGIERLVLESVFWDFEDLLLDDGCTSIAVMHPEKSIEVQLDEHKLLVIYAETRLPFERILRGHGLQRDDRIRFISQGEHLHTSHTRFARRFDELAARLGAG
jgi:hypothetical protein